MGRMSMILVFVLIISMSVMKLMAVEISGTLNSDLRVFTEDGTIYWNQNKLNLKFQKKRENTEMFCELEIRTRGFPRLHTTADLMAFGKNNITPLTVSLKEAYIDLYGFLFPNIDLRIGKQRIAWGTADSFNPTDNINPDDLEDIFAFGKHIATTSLSSKIYFGGYTFSFVFQPVFTPAKMPCSEWASAFSEPLVLPSPLRLAGYADTIVLPENRVNKTSSIAFKIARTFFDFDFSLSYFRGRDDFPLVNYVKLSPVDTSTPTLVNADISMIYPGIQVVGFDMAGQIGIIGVWAENAVFFPEKVNLIQDLTELGQGRSVSSALDNVPYVKFVLGGDYTFENGVYVNLQYIHGFINERGRNNLEDYIMFGSEKDYLNGNLKIKPLTFVAEVKNFSRLGNNYALIYSPMLTYSPYDNLEINLGGMIFGGKETTSFGRLKDKNSVFMNFKYYF